MEDTTVGLCASCEHSRRILTRRGGNFIRCNLSDRMSEYPRYPVLPVLACRGFAPGEEESERRAEA